MPPWAAWADAKAILATFAVCVMAGGIAVLIGQWLAGTWEWLTRPRGR